MCMLDANGVGKQFGLSARMIAWLTHSGHLLTPELPDDETARIYLAEMEVPSDCWQEILTTRPDLVADQEICWIIERFYSDLVGNLGNGDLFDGWPCLPVDGTSRVRHLYIWVFLAAVPNVRRYHVERGIRDAVGWEALRSVGRAVKDSRALYGTSGLLFDLWVQPLAFRGVHYPIGRLAYDIGGASDRQSASVDLNVHISSGRPLGPDECDASFAAAITFFHTHFPERRVRHFKCHSWLLDPQLADYLPEDANIVQFQRRFELIPHDERSVNQQADIIILEYVFDRIHTDIRIGDELLAHLPQRSSLQRAFVNHLRAGKHWYSRAGWFPAKAMAAAQKSMTI